MGVFLAFWLGCGFAAFVILCVIQRVDNDPQPTAGDVIVCALFGPYVLYSAIAYLLARISEAPRG